MCENCIKARAIYDRATARSDALKKVITPASKTWFKAEAKAKKAYTKALNPAWTAYKRAGIKADKAYDAADAPYRKALEAEYAKCKNGDGGLRADYTQVRPWLKCITPKCPNEAIEHEDYCESCKRKQED